MENWTLEPKNPGLHFRSVLYVTWLGCENMKEIKCTAESLQHIIYFSIVLQINIRISLTWEPTERNTNDLCEAQREFMHANEFSPNSLALDLCSACRLSRSVCALTRTGFLTTIKEQKACMWFGGSGRRAVYRLWEVNQSNRMLQKGWSFSDEQRNIYKIRAQVVSLRFTALRWRVCSRLSLKPFSPAIRAVEEPNRSARLKFTVTCRTEPTKHAFQLLKKTRRLAVVS